jgi:two-component system response regulator DesR
MIRIVIAEDHAMVGGALQALLSTERDLEVRAVVLDGKAALAAVARHLPDVLLTDVEMPSLDGLELAARVQREYPGTKVLILTTFARAGYLRRALESGARGYLLKDRPSSELADAIRRVSQGLQVIDPVLAVGAWEAGPDPLTARERQILARAAAGESNQAIARAMHLTEGTVKNYMAAINSKLGAANRTEAAVKARALGWL